MASDRLLNIQSALDSPLDRATLDQRGEGDILDSEAQRLEQRDVAIRAAAWRRAAGEIADFADILPGKLSGGDAIDELPGFQSRLRDRVGEARIRAQDGRLIEFPSIGRVGPGGIDVNAGAQPRAKANRLGRFRDRRDDIRSANT